MTRFPYTPAFDPRYRQPGGFSGPSYPIPVPPQHQWNLPQGIMPGMFPTVRTNYAPMFTEDGVPSCEDLTEDRFGYPVLPNSRGAFIKVCSFHHEGESQGAK
jgi:hypothetical protein